MKIEARRNRSRSRLTGNSHVVSRQRSRRASTDSPPWLLQAMFEQLPSAGVMLDESGAVLLVNKAMRSRADRDGLDLLECDHGRDFTSACPTLFGDSGKGAPLVLAGVRRVMAGEQVEVRLDLSCPSEISDKWVRVRVVRLGPTEAATGFRILVLLEDFTLDKRVARALEGQDELKRAFQTARSEWEKAEERLQELSGGLINAQEHERSRIARELHDDLNQRLALLSIDLDHYGQRLPRSLDEHRRRTRDMRTRTHEISAEVQRISYQLHPSKLETLGLVAAVRSFCQDISARKALKVEFSHHQIPASVPKDTSLCLFRVMQEALSNVLKHSGASAAKVELSGTSKAIHLRISDSGWGINHERLNAQPGLGLVSMRERLRLVGGEFKIESSPRGTCVSARVGLSDEIQ